VKLQSASLNFTVLQSTGYRRPFRMFRSFTFFCLTRGTDKRNVKWDQNLKRRDHVKHIDVSYYYLHFMFTYVCACVSGIGKI
jgi:hypothetical protein